LNSASFESIATAPIEILSLQVASSLSIPARDAEDLLALACSILREKPSRVAVLEHGRLSEVSARMLADAAAELEA
jgi:CYTH domain-containing protein